MLGDASRKAESCVGGDLHRTAAATSQEEGDEHGDRGKGSEEERGKGAIRYGMVGGGQGAFIGARAPHRGAHGRRVRAGGRRAVVRPGAGQGVGRRARPRPGPQLRHLRRRWRRPRPSAKDGIEAVAIVTPNHMHFGPAKAFLEAGIHVICDKPLTSTLADAKKLAAIVEKTGKLFVLTHNYTGYPMVRQAREMVAKGVLGEIRVVQAEYPQDWLTDAASRRAARSRRPGAPTRSSRAPAARPATSARMPTISPASSPAWSSRRSPPISNLRARAASSTTTPTSCCASSGGARRA